MKKLGFGLMRLPMTGKDVDTAQVDAMVDLFLEKGFDYFDTAYGYLDGKSEQAAKTCLVDRYPRESFRLATKLPAWAGAKDADEAKQMFYTSLERTGAGYFDRYLLHNLGQKRTMVFEDYRLWEFAAARKAEGLIKQLGFSMHDSADALDKVLTEHPEVDFVQLQINYADWDSPVIQSRLCYETAKKHGKPVIVMEPVKGGNLANPLHGIKELFHEVNPGVSPSGWAIRFAASLDNVDTVLSGMSTMEQMRDNVAVMENFEPISDKELEAVKQAQKILAELPLIPCTSCKYCVEGCPMAINIPGIFRCANMYTSFKVLPAAKEEYDYTVSKGGKASDCIQCGACESVCPQRIEIIEELKKAAQTLE